jgi:hypothetical protein
MFDLTKWYADAVSADGDFLVGYCARLHCGGFSVSYSSVLDSRGQRHCLRPSSIDAGETGIRWRTPALGIDAQWRGSTAAIRKTIFQDEEGAVDWHCVIPGGSCSAGREARGYVECLHLTIPPWRLPIECLRWGRFLGARNSLIWIDWIGGAASRNVYLNGLPVSTEEIGDDGLALADGRRLILDRGLVFRSGALGSTVFNAVPGLDRIAPVRMFRVEETKWRSRSIFSVPGEPADEGWSIHEVVRWP